MIRTVINAKTLTDMRNAFYATKQRCYNPKNRNYSSYGGRGIVICERWLTNVDNMIDDMGLRPPGMTLERRDNDGPYSPDNCVWATRAVQGANTRDKITITYQGVTRRVIEWAEITGIPYHTLKTRIRRLGYTPEQALTKPIKFGLTPQQEQP